MGDVRIGNKANIETISDSDLFLVSKLSGATTYIDKSMTFSQLRGRFENVNNFSFSGTATGNVLNTATLSATTFYGDGSYLTNVDHNYLTGGTYSGGYIYFSGIGSNFSVDVSGIGLGGIVDITYASLKALYDAATMVAGTYYQIIDFQTIYDQPDFDAGGIPKGIVVTKTAIVEPLVVFASSSSSLETSALSPLFPKDIIKYDITYTATPQMGVAAKGKIVERIDNKNNRTSYDHRKILFKRYKLSVGAIGYDSYKDTGFASIEVLTFKASCRNNYIGDQQELAPNYLLPNNVFGEENYNNNLQTSARNNTFNFVSFDNYIGHGFSDNIMGEFFVDNHIGDIVWGNVFNSSCRGNNIGCFIYRNVFGVDCSYNITGNNFYNNVLGTNFSENKIGSNFHNNTVLAENFMYNIIGNYFNTNTVFRNFRLNTIGHIFQNNNIGENTYCNKIGNEFMFNTIIGDATDGFIHNDIGDNSQNNTIDYGFQKNVINNVFSTNTIGKYFYDNHIGNDFVSNTITNYFYNNVVGNSCSSNIIYDDFIGNHIGNDFENNALGSASGGYGYGTGYASFINNVIGENFDGNIIEHDFTDNKVDNNFIGNTIATNFRFNRVDNNFIGNTLAANFMFNNIKASVGSIDFLSATHVYESYNCTIEMMYKSTGNVLRLWYFDADSNIPVFALITD